jgi:hypothetical protein
MKCNLIFLLLIIPLKVSGQIELARINDQDGYTNIRVSKGSNSEVIGKLFNGDLFFCEPSQDDWWLIRKYDHQEGYVHKSRIIQIKNLSDSKIKEVIFLGLDSLNKKNREFLATVYDSNLVLNLSKRLDVEAFAGSIFNALLSFISDQFCKNKDPELLDKFVKTLIIDEGSADESPPMTFTKCFICSPDLVLSHVDKLQIKDREVLINALTFGFETLPYIEETKNSSFKQSKEKFDSWVKKARL